MTKYLWPFMLLLTVPVALTVGADQAKNEVKTLRYFESINISNANVKQCVWFAMKEYNKGSEDKYVFLVDRTLHAKLQVGKFCSDRTFTYGGTGGGRWRECTNENTILNVRLVMHTFTATEATHSRNTSHMCWTQVLVTYINLVTRNHKSNALVLIETRRKMKPQEHFAIMLP